VPTGPTLPRHQLELDTRAREVGQALPRGLERAKRLRLEQRRQQLCTSPLPPAARRCGGERLRLGTQQPELDNLLGARLGRHHQQLVASSRHLSHAAHAHRHGRTRLRQLRPLLIQQQPHLAPALAGDNMVALPESAALHKHRAEDPETLAHHRLEDLHGRVAVDQRVAGRKRGVA